ncbi:MULTISPECIES: cell envelope integrity protein CreD [unclassified Leeuwenhoekiella]|uniref:cell envelope integrity protein CreD n=1 Tax=unclassified Leeuwenhoekiella TaxID=2615029 RepID=UPI000C558C0A|nr:MULTISPECIES: cell envelope integrity protein CreD [unclassified Leeuwenhoekiella]MAW94480.1 cell envelope integrity protein CreD [Leeuwenhoekiella sp.]MAW96976.1 cell envelope integrity protein CreD [Leeuwenhoekiella sp.]MBA81158.1 cell envelope integrity protein CreD [Leeuwenhoekiella sp.]|tara:strand:- start:13514 stop:14890 length:1377 start_codon:yes stop_codon:yes gene_type:complete
MNTSNPQPPNKFIHWIKNSITARMFMVGFLTLILLIPLFFVQSLIEERAERQQEVVAEINEKWGEEVLVYGPVLKIPYTSATKKTIKNTDTKSFETQIVQEVHIAYFFPEELTLKTQVNPEIKNRSIYKTTVYNSQTHFEGSFAVPDFSDAPSEPSAILWDKARVVFQTSNLKGVNEQVKINLEGTAYPFSSKYEKRRADNLTNLELYTMESAFIKPESLPQEQTVRFTMDLHINGSEQLRFIPIGKTTEVQITSDWETNNFTGNYLPYNQDKLAGTGFDAKWKVLDINRPFPQEFFNHLPGLKEYAFGVNFMIPVDEYQKSERTAKYGFLVIGLTFLIFFLIQTLSKIAIHPFQYLMIGLALVMFYTLLISISEHSNYLNAYLVASVAVVLLISLYARSILKNIKFPVFIGLSLTLLYSFIYVIIQLENYALLVGSIGLFIILALVMYVSRKIDWNS